jgi:O-antigen/teichoic acid export membrane protein
LGFSFRIVIVLGIGLCVAVSPLGSVLMNLVYGREYVSAGPLLSVLIWSNIAVFFGIVISNGIIAKNLQKWMPIATGIGALVNIALNLFLIPRWGAMGAVWATNLSYSLAAAVVFLFFPDTSSMTVLGFRILSRPLALALPTAIIVSRLQVAALAKFVLGFAVYAVGIWFFGIVQRAEVTRVTSILRTNVPFLRPTIRSEG